MTTLTRVTPDNILELKDNEIFVFGSNLAGLHGAGAAKTALLITEIGCGLAGYQVHQIAPLFKEAIHIDNICLPQKFWEILKPT